MRRPCHSRSPARSRRRLRARPAALVALAALLALGGCDGDAAPPTALSAPGPSLARKKGAVTGNGYELLRLGGDRGEAIALNRSGIVVGAAMDGSDQRAAFWSVDASGAVTGPSWLGLPGTGLRAWAIGVNDAGHVIALEQRSARGFLYDVNADALVELSRPAGAIGVTPRSINADDVVTGNAFFEVGGDTVWRTVAWTDPFDAAADPTVLPLPEGHVAVSGCSLPVPLNDAGVVFGLSQDGEGGCWRVRWEVAADGSVSGPRVLEPAGASFYGEMNEREQLAGFAGSYPDLRAVVREPDGSRVTLGPATGDALAVAAGLDDPAAGEPLLVAGTSDRWAEDEAAVLWSIASDGTVADPVVLPIGDDGVSSRARAVERDGRVAGTLVWDDPHPRRVGGQAAALWVPTADGGGSNGGDGGGGDCVPKGPHGNNCK